MKRSFPARHLAGARLAALAVVVAALSSCGLLSDKETTSKMNVEQATQHMESMIRESVRGLDPEPTLDRISQGSDYGPCLDPSDGGSEERVQLGRGYWLHDIPASSYDAVARQVLQRFKDLGYSLDGEPVLGTDSPQVFALDTKNSFVISLATGGKGMFIGAGSPCLWFDGVPGHTFVDDGGEPVPAGTPGGRLVVVDH